MRLKQLAVAFAFAGAVVAAAGLLAAPANAAPKKRVYYNRDRTVVVSRDENGRTRTKIIVQKRSYLDPGTEPLPSERNTLDYVQNPGPARRQRARQHGLRQRHDRLAGPVHAAEQPQSLDSL